MRLGSARVAVEHFQRLSRCGICSTFDLRAAGHGTRAGDDRRAHGHGFRHEPRLVDVRSIARPDEHVPHAGAHRPSDRAELPAPKADRCSVRSARRSAGREVVARWHDRAPGYFQMPAAGASAPAVQPTGGRKPKRIVSIPTRPIACDARPAPRDRRTAHGARGAAPKALVRCDRRAVHHLSRRRRDNVYAGAPAESSSPISTRYRRLRCATGQAAPVVTGGTPAPVSHTASHAIMRLDPATGRVLVAPPQRGAPDVEEVCPTGPASPEMAPDRTIATPTMPFDITDTERRPLRTPTRRAESGAASAQIRPVQTLDKALTEWAAEGAGKRGPIVLSAAIRRAPAARPSRRDAPDPSPS